jgi:anti-sigma B factor antagonist
MRTAQSTLAVDVTTDGPVAQLRLNGELDVTSAPLLQTVVDQVLSTRRTPLCSSLVLDLSCLAFADASGLSPVLMARALLSQRSGTLELRHPRRCVRRVLRILDIDDLTTPGPDPLA